ncbi:hypothetical protein V6N13_097462 [Hibiscus sabdariffa]
MAKEVVLVSLTMFCTIFPVNLVLVLNTLMTTGQMVYGVIEGPFDDGYLLSVNMVDTNTHLRGLVFLPGRLTPITIGNDVALDAKI